MSSSNGIADIIVTAQKRAESVQDTPISIAVMGAEALETRGITNIMDLTSGAVPSLRTTPIAGRSSAANIGMRGLVPNDSTQISRDPTVGVYIDGVYLGRVQGLGMEISDIERMEVLRGPQGTLFGRNTMGGAISIVTRKPTGEFGLDVAAGVRNWDGQRVSGHLNLPEFAGFKIKLSGLYNKRDGWVTNPLPGGSDWSAIKRYGYRASVLWDLIDDFSVHYTLDQSWDKSTASYPVILDTLPGNTGLAPMFKVDGEHRVTGSARAGFQLDPSYGKSTGHTITAEWDVAQSLTVRSITAWRKLNQNQADNWAGTYNAYRPNGYLGRTSFGNVDQNQFSQELQLVGTLDRLNYVLGAFYFKENATDNAFAPLSARYNATGTAIIQLDPSYSATPFPDRASEAHAKSTAIFAQATYTPALLDDRLHLTGGLRYTNDRKRGRLLAIKGVDAPARMQFNFQSERVDPAATIAFDVTDDINTYVRWGTAYRSGGANSRSETFRTFKAETLSSWELGLKSDLFDRRARMNLALWTSRLKNMQQEATPPTNPSAQETVNGLEAAIFRGLEADLMVVPAQGLSLTGSYAYTHVKMPNIINPFSGVTAKWNATITPTHAGSVALDYGHRLGDFGKLTFHVDGIYSSGYYSYSTDKTKTGQTFLVNGRVTLGEIESPLGNVEYSLWGKNLTNVQYVEYDFEMPAPLAAIRIGYFNEPRSYGLDVRVRF